MGPLRILKAIKPDIFPLHIEFLLAQNGKLHTYKLETSCALVVDVQNSGSKKLLTSVRVVHWVTSEILLWEDNKY